ncbi:MAG: deoxyhypusine synthase family protein [Candidatus Heimdallarchaeota archaeon]|nr:deoxyhypusine synthase family protein [Candidatus Heimdallarchaeota archaeon]
MNHHKHKKIDQINLKEIQSVNDLSRQFSNSGVFGAGRLGKAIDILEEAEKNHATFLVGLAGAMVPGGMREVIAQAIRDGRIHALTTTGANITHDLIEAFGGAHVRDISYSSDAELLDKGIDRVWDAFVSEGSFEGFEDHIRKLLDILWEEKAENDQLILTPSQLINYFGSKIDDPNSIVKAAYDMNIPIFVPAISDSVLGLQIWLFAQFKRLIIDATKDLGTIQDIFHDASSCCALTLGGGVPKNFTLQSALMASKHYAYAVQITMDRVETGGLSGASLEEAISWGKLEKNAKFMTVIADVTIVLPIIYSTLRARSG